MVNPKVQDALNGQLNAELGQRTCVPATTATA